MDHFRCKQTTSCAWSVISCGTGNTITDKSLQSGNSTHDARRMTLRTLQERTPSAQWWLFSFPAFNKITCQSVAVLVSSLFCGELHLCGQRRFTLETRKTMVSCCLGAEDNGWQLLHCRPLGLTLIIFLCDEENLSFIFAQDRPPHPPRSFRLPTRGSFVSIFSNTRWTSNDESDRTSTVRVWTSRMLIPTIHWAAKEETFKDQDTSFKRL